MPLRCLVEPTLEPVTLAQAKQHLRIDANDDDQLINALITAARVDAENRMQRTLVQTTWEATFDAFPGVYQALPLLMPRVLGVDAVRYIDAAGVEQTLSAAQYLVDDCHEPGWLVLAPAKAWPVTQARPNAVRVTYRAGYGPTADDVPKPIKQWILLAVGSLYENREREITGVSVVPNDFVDHLLDTYRIMSV